MPKKSYVKKPYQSHTITCGWTLGGKDMTYNYSYSGNAVDGIIACYKDVLWSKHPTFYIKDIETREA